MEAAWGCLAAAIALLVLAGPIVALVLALRARAETQRLATALADVRGRLGVLEQRLTEALQRLPVRGEATADAVPEGAGAMLARAFEPATVVAKDATTAGAPAPLSAPPTPPQVSRQAPPAAPPFPSMEAGAPARGEAPAGEPRRSPDGSETERSSVFPGVAPAGAGTGERGPGLEERLGARLPVWLGGIALALAGAFLVKYSVDRGWLSPTVRVALGLLFGVALLGLGEWLRPRAHAISQALSAAGIADLYAVLLAGVRLYALIPPLVGFALMGANTAVAVLLSLRQGPMIALLGLVGGFATPALVASGERHLGGLLAYLFLLDAGLVAVTRRRRWPLLGLGALMASLVWVAAWLAGAFRAGDSIALGIFLLAAVALFTLATGAAGKAREATASAPEPLLARAIAGLAAGGALVLLARVVDAGGYGPVEWGMFALLAAGCYLLAWRRPELFALAPLAAAAALALLAVRGHGLPGGAAPAYLLTAGLLGGGLAAGAWAALFRTAQPARWGILAASVLLLFPAVAWHSTRDALELPWAWVALGLAALTIAAAAPVARSRADLPQGEAVLAALAVAATLHASFALPLALERAWLSVAFALETPLLLALRRRLRVPALGALAAGAAALAAVRLLLNPEILGYPIGSGVLANWLLWGYGAPVAAFLLASRVARGSGMGWEVPLYDALAAAFAFALTTLEVWQLYSPAALSRPVTGWGPLEWGTQAAAWFALGFLLIEGGRRLGRRVFSVAGRLAVALAGAQALLIHGLFENPALTAQPVGGAPIVNLLLWSYGVPLLALLVAARRVASEGGRRLPGAARVAALLLGFALVTLEVRQLFRGSVLAGGEAGGGEQFGYSAAWVLYGTLLLVLGIVKRSRALRLAALAVMSIAVLKVFLWDTRALEDLFRVFSFLGLGASLLLLAWLYQRYVFRREERA